MSKNYKDTVMQANPGTIVGLLSLSTNSNTASLFHANKASAIKLEINSVTSVIVKLDREQPHSSGSSRLAAFQEYLSELGQKQTSAEYWANHHYYRDVIMQQLKSTFSDSILDISSLSSIGSWLSIF